MTADQITRVIKTFCEEMANRVPDQVKPFLVGRKDKIKQRDLRQSPERFVSENLVWPLLDALEYDYITEAYLQGHNGQADFLLQNTSEPVLGECKSFNHYKKAVSDLREYLNHRATRSVFGIATDGVNWLFIREPGDLRRNVEIVSYHTFRPAMFEYWKRQGTVPPELEGHYVLWNSTVGSYQENGELRSVDLQKSASVFESSFQPSNLNERLHSSDFDLTLSEFSDGDRENTENHTLDDF